MLLQSSSSCGQVLFQPIAVTLRFTMEGVHGPADAVDEASWVRARHLHAATPARFMLPCEGRCLWCCPRPCADWRAGWYAEGAWLSLD